MSSFWQSLFFIAVAEMGDKTQLVSLAFATRFSALTVLGGVFTATMAVHLFSVAAGETLGMLLPLLWVRLLAGLAFLGFGLWTIRGDSLTEDAHGKGGRFGPFLTVAVTFFLAELGDKTMLATITISSQELQFVPVWLGSSLGMVVADALAIGVGVVAGRQLPQRAIKVGAATLFLGSGLWIIAQALAGSA